MAAEDYIDLMSIGEYEEIYGDSQYFEEPDIPPKENYTDRFTFNGRRIRTRKQRKIVRENKIIHGRQW